MRIVVPKETFPSEARVVVLPSSAKALVEAGHDVFVQAGASVGLSIADEEYKRVGVTIISDPADLYAMARPIDGSKGMIIKLKAPSWEEFSMMDGAILFCMLHIGQNKERLYYMGSQDLVGVAMEALRDSKGTRLVDQTEITGRTGVYHTLNHLMRQSGKLPEETQVVVLGYGSVATGAIAACAQLGMKIKIVRKEEFKFLPIWLDQADLLVNGISWPESERDRLPYLVTREHLQNANPNLVILDLSVDLPSPIETITRSTDYLNPYYIDEGRVHISIYGYPGLVAVSSSRIYSEQALPLALTIANKGGLKGIRRTGDLGSYIYNAIIDPKNRNAYGDWESYKPAEPANSDIE